MVCATCPRTRTHVDCTVMHVRFSCANVRSDGSVIAMIAAQPRHAFMRSAQRASLPVKPCGIAAHDGRAVRSAIRPSTAAVTYEWKGAEKDCKTVSPEPSFRPIWISAGGAARCPCLDRVHSCGSFYRRSSTLEWTEGDKHQNHMSSESTALVWEAVQQVFLRTTASLCCGCLYPFAPVLVPPWQS